MEPVNQSGSTSLVPTRTTTEELLARALQVIEQQGLMLSPQQALLVREPLTITVPGKRVKTPRKTRTDTPYLYIPKGSKTRVWIWRRRINEVWHKKSTGQTDLEEAKKMADAYAEDARKNRHTVSRTMPTVGQWYADYEEAYIDSADHAEGTKKAMRIRLRDFVAVHKTKRLDQIDELLAKKWINQRVHPPKGSKQRAYSKNTVQNELVVLRMFFGKAHEMHFVKNPFTNVDGFEPTARKRVLELSEQKAFFAALQALPVRRPEMVGTYADAGLAMLGSGMRTIELRRLKPANVIDGFIVVHGKGDKLREIPIDPLIQEALERQRQRRGLDADDEEHRLWPISRCTLNAKFVTASTQAKLKSNVSPHAMRRSYGTRHVIAGTRPKELMDLMGHASMEITMKYYAHMNRKDLAAVVKRANIGLKGL